MTATLPAVEDTTRREVLAGLAALSLIAASPGGVAAAAEGTRPIEHWAGTTQVPLAPARIATLVGIYAANLVTLGLVPVAAGDGVQALFADVADVLPEGLDLSGIRTVGDEFDPNLEALAAVAPELIIGDDGHGLGLYRLLSQIAPTVLVVYGANGNWRPRFLAVADAVGRTEQARRVEAAYEAFLAELPDAVRALEIAFIRPDQGQFRLDGTPGGFAGSVAADAGITVTPLPPGVGEQEPDFVVLSNERLDVLSGADLIVVPDFRSVGEEDDSVTQFARNPLWAGLPAVRAGAVLQVPGLAYNGGNHLAAESLLRAIAQAVT